MTENRLEEIEKRLNDSDGWTLPKPKPDIQWLIRELKSARKQVEELEASFSNSYMKRENAAMKGVLIEIQHEIVGKTTVDTVDIHKYFGPGMYRRHLV